MENKSSTQHTSLRSIGDSISTDNIATSAFDEAAQVMTARGQSTRDLLSSFLDDKRIDTSKDDDVENIASECNSHFAYFSDRYSLEDFQLHIMLLICGPYRYIFRFR